MQQTQTSSDYVFDAHITVVVMGSQQSADFHLKTQPMASSDHYCT